MATDDRSIGATPNRRSLNPETELDASKQQIHHEQERTMNRYTPSNFRPAFGIAAAALSAVTLAIAVVLPVGLSATCPDDVTLVRATPAPTEVAIVPARIEVVAQPVRAVVLEPVNVVGNRHALRT
jgi:hypothetical protein